MVDAGNYYLTRLVFQKALAFVYLIAFLIILHQFKPLLGEKGLLPVGQFIKYINFSSSPSIFFIVAKDWAFTLFGAIGVFLSLLALLGISEKYGLFVHILVWFLLWVVYLSFVNVGQTFYSFGWESLLLEAGFLTIFLGDANSKAPFLIIILLRLLLFKVMFGAGMIKIRGDECWKDLTCLNYHYETQPIPNPLSWYFHHHPAWFHKMGVLYNHLVELIVPFFYFAPQPIAAFAGLLTLFFHTILAISGNFAFLSFLTAVLAITTLPDTLLVKIIPMAIPAQLTFTAFNSYLVSIITIIIGILSIRPIANLASPNQAMNRGYDSLHLVNTYGAFGAITKERYEIIILGADDKTLNEKTKWQEYEFLAKPGRLNKLPAQIAPYHLRLDWLMWFAAFRKSAQDPWFFHLMAKILQGDKQTLSLLQTNPFKEGKPNFIKADLYKYNFTTPLERIRSGNWWKREYAGEYFPAVSLEDQEFKSALKQLGWDEL